MEDKDYLKEKIDVTEKRLNSHSDRLDKLEQFRASTDTQIRNLIAKIDGLITTIKWSSGFFIGGVVAFFFYALERGIIKWLK